MATESNWAAGSRCVNCRHAPHEGAKCSEMVHGDQCPCDLSGDVMPYVEEDPTGMQALAESWGQPEEPIEDRLQRAWLNGFREGFQRAARGDTRWDR